MCLQILDYITYVTDGKEKRASSLILKGKWRILIIYFIFYYLSRAYNVFHQMVKISLYAELYLSYAVT